MTILSGSSQDQNEHLIVSTRVAIQQVPEPETRSFPLGDDEKLMVFGPQQAAVRTIIAHALAEHASESGRSVDALVAIRQADAIVKALERAGYEIKSRT